MATADSVLAAQDAALGASGGQAIGMKAPAAIALRLMALSASARASETEILSDMDERIAAEPSPSPARNPTDAGALTLASSSGHRQELMLNAFRAPSIGLEYRVGAVSVHAGGYTTA